MNKTEKIISILLGAVLAWYLFTNAGQSKTQPPAPSAAVQTASEQPAAQPDATRPAAAPSVAAVQLPETPEETVVLENDELKLELSS